MKKLLSILLLTVMIMSLSGGTVAGATAEPELVLRIGNQQSSSHSSVLAFQEFKKAVEEASDGRITCDIYADAILGDENALQEMMTMGTVDMMYSGNLPSYIPLLGALELPYLYENRDHIKAFVATEAFADLMQPLEEHNMKVIAAFENGFRQITTAKQPINSAEDLKGVLFRTAATPGEIFAFEAAGAIATTIAYTELYSALQQGVVDGQENPIQNIYNQKFYEVQKYLAVTNHIYNSGFIVIRNDLYNELPDDLRDIIMKCIVEAQDWQIDYVANNDQRMLDEIEAFGVEITYPDVAEIEEAMSGAYEMMYKEYPESKALVEAILAAKP